MKRSRVLVFDFDELFSVRACDIPRKSHMMDGKKATREEKIVDGLSMDANVGKFNHLVQNIHLAISRPRDCRSDVRPTCGR
jgi:hypothetical protein